MGLSGEKIDWSQEAPNRERLWFFLVMGVIVYLFATLFWSHAQTRDEEIDKDIETVRVQIEAMEKILAVKIEPTIKKDSDEKKIEDDPRFVPYLEGKIIPKEELLRQLDSSLSDPSLLGTVELIDKTVGEATDKETFIRIPFGINISGGFIETMNYMERIEKLPLLIIYEGVSVSAPQDNPQILSTRITGSLYVVKSAAALQAGGGGR